MKAGIEHRVPLSARAFEIIERMAETRSGDFVFPGQRRGRPLGHTSLRRLCSGTETVHGFRSSFRDWCGEETSYPREICRTSACACDRIGRRASLQARRCAGEAARAYGSMGGILRAGRGRECDPDHSGRKLNSRTAGIGRPADKPSRITWFPCVPLMHADAREMNDKRSDVITIRHSKGEETVFEKPGAICDRARTRINTVLGDFAPMICQKVCFRRRGKS